MSLAQIATDDGTCPSHVFRPAGQGPWPAVLVYMDGVGIRPAMLAIGERLAASGYYALVPDLFYRAGPYEPMNARAVFTDPALRQVMRERLAAHASQAKFMADTRFFLDYLASQPDVRPGGIATVGYCMGG